MTPSDEDECRKMLNTRTGNPFFEWTFWTAPERAIKEDAAYLNSVAHSAIKAARARDADHPHDLLTPFLAIDGLSDQYLRDVFMSLLLAGRDTTSQTMAWFSYWMSKNLDVQQRLYEEIIAALPGDTGLGACLLVFSLPLLTYTHHLSTRT